MKKVLSLLLCAALVTGCGMSKTGSGALIGTGAGAALGAGIGYLIGGNGQGAAIGAAIGTAVGAGTGALIGNKMDKKAAELAKLENAKVEKVTDINGLPALKVTFDNGILFEVNKSNLSDVAKAELDEFVGDLADMAETNLTVYGHTDNTGTAQVNERVSNQRAEAVSKYLQSKGIAKDRLTAQGLSFNYPVADNATAEGRAQNRRVEIYISANEEMVKEAEAGSLN